MKQMREWPGANKQNMIKTKHLLISFLIGSASMMLGQTTLNLKINAALDDHEERTTGPVPQTGTTGNMYPGSIALELGNESATSDPVLVGLRFTNVTIPKFATIMNAYIQFTVKGISKNTDPCSIAIYAENNQNPAPFTDNAFSLSSRSFTSGGSVAWSVSGSSWGTVGSAGPDQRTPEIKALLQPLVFNNNWVPGNPMAFFIKGIGTREVQSYEGDPTKTAELVITYSVTGGTPTGVSEVIGNISSVDVYPNPFKNSFTTNIKVSRPSDISIFVYDITGKLVEETHAKHVETGVFSYMSVSQLKPGMYFVKVKTDDKEEVIKVISE